MAWISLVIVVLAFMLGLDKVIPHQPFTVIIPFLRISINIPYSGYLRVFLYTLIIWLVLWWILLRLEKYSGYTLLRKAGLRNGMMFATRPHVINYIAVILASIVLIFTTLKFVFDFVMQIFTGKLLGHLIGLITGRLRVGNLDYILNLIPGDLRSKGVEFWLSHPDVSMIPILPFLGSRIQPSLPVPIVPWKIIILCFLTLIAAFAFGREQRWRYENEIKRDQIHRKHRQDEIIIPSSGK